MKRTSRYLYFSILLCLSLLCILRCEKQDGIRSLFPGPGFEKGWSWYGMPSEEYAHARGQSDFIKEFAITKMATLSYFRGNIQDTTFTVKIIKFKSPESASSFYHHVTEFGLELGIDTDEVTLKTNRLFFVKDVYFVLCMSRFDTDRMTNILETVAKRIEARI